MPSRLLRSPLVPALSSNLLFSRPPLRSHFRPRPFSSAPPSHNAPAAAAAAAPRRETARAADWLFFGTPVAVTFALGVWQVKRLSRKQQLIRDRQAGLRAPPTPLAHLYPRPSASATADDDLHQQRHHTPAPPPTSDVDHRRVVVRGVLLHDREMLVGPRAAPKSMPPAVLQWGGTSGLQVVTPCALPDGRVFLVNRGWVPQRLAERAKRRAASVSPPPFMDDARAASTLIYDYDPAPVSAPPGAPDAHSVAGTAASPVEFTGVVRVSHERNRFTPRNVPERGEWFVIDGEEMLRACGLHDRALTTHVVEAVEPLPSNGWPFPRSLDEFVDFRTPPSVHITYATTWFSLSAALALLTRMRARQAARRYKQP